MDYTPACERVKIGEFVRRVTTYLTDLDPKRYPVLRDRSALCLVEAHPKSLLGSVLVWSFLAYGICGGGLEPIIKIGAPAIDETEKLTPVGGSGPVEKNILALENAARSTVASTPLESGNAMPNWIALANFSDPAATCHFAFSMATATVEAINQPNHWSVAPWRSSLVSLSSWSMRPEGIYTDNVLDREDKRTSMVESFLKTMAALGLIALFMLLWGLGVLMRRRFFR